MSDTTQSDLGPPTSITQLGGIFPNDLPQGAFQTLTLPHGAKS